MRALALMFIAALAAAGSLAQNTATTEPGPWNVYSGTSKVGGDHASEAACIAAAAAASVPAGSTVRFGCRTITSVFVSAPVSLPAETWSRVAAEGAAFTVAAGSTVRYGAGTSFVERAVDGAGQCTNAFFGSDPAPEVVKACDVRSGSAAPAPAPAPAPTPTPGPTGAVTLHFAPSGSNGNPGTQALPKRDTTGINLSTLPAGSSVLFQRGGAYPLPELVILENLNTNSANPLTFDAYGTGAVPVIDVVGSGFLVGGRHGNTSNDGGYVFRNLVLRGRDVNASYGLFLYQNVRDVVIENVEVTGFYFGIQSSAALPHGVTNVVLRNNVIRRNRGMGILGQFSDTLIEGNTIEENNFSGSGFEHGAYLSGNPVAAGQRLYSGANVTLRNNRFIRNSVNGTMCTGGNMTFHGQMDNVLIEGNTIEQSPGWQDVTQHAGGGCWLMSITQGWESPRGAEAMTRFVVRNNRLVNGGNTAIAVNSAPGIVIEGNVIINEQPTPQLGIGLGHGFDYGPSHITNGLYPNGDVADGGAVARNNTICRRHASGSGEAVRDNAPSTTQSGNLIRVGADAFTGPCAN